ncbi:MAG TPA: FtsX-like permease family protein [Thermoanaerobaculia bacterium]|nr:FtsX-like permease family protein [Thermoanaerobaculia bacterium]
MALSLAGGLLGLCLAPLLTRALARLDLDLAPRWKEIAVDGRVALATLGVALAMGLVAGLAPVFHWRRANLRALLSDGGPGTSVGWRRNRLTSLLAVLQIALSFVLLVSAGLLIRSFHGLMRVDPGFDPDHVVTVAIALPREDKPAERVAFFATALERLRALPGVQRAGFASALPLGGSNTLFAFRIPGRPAADRDAAPFYSVTTGYLEAMKVPLRAGRYFEEKDRAGSPPASIISQELAQRYFGSESPIGRQLLLGAPNPTASEIVGVVGNVRDQALDFDGGPAIYGLHDQAPFRAMTLCLRTRSDPVALLPTLRRVIRQVDPNQPLDKAAAMNELVLDSVSDRRLALLVIGAFGAISLVLAVVGVYGLLAYTVGKAGREIGVRMALGAERRHIRKLVWDYAALVLAPGLLLGTLGALAATRLLSAQLFGVSPTDPTTYAAVAVLLTTMALLACQAPVRRAAGLDPKEALNDE